MELDLYQQRMNECKIAESESERAERGAEDKGEGKGHVADRGNVLASFDFIVHLLPLGNDSTRFCSS